MRTQQQKLQFFVIPEKVKEKTDTENPQKKLKRQRDCKWAGRGRDNVRSPSELAPDLASLQSAAE